MYIKADAASAQSGGTVNLRCPNCRQNGTFALAAVPNTQRLQLIPGPGTAGIYVCPKPDCHACVYVVTDPATPTAVIASFPPELLDFDATTIPTTVPETLEEAIQCHAQDCFIAAAIMVRKTLEELCRERGATGGNLKERIADLGSKVVLPQELLDGLDDLRLVGNDAAHIESTVFNGIGKEEIEVGIEFATEVLKAVYQYSDLLARLRALKQNP
jgi:hypothetical protein